MPDRHGVVVVVVCIARSLIIETRFRNRKIRTRETDVVTGCPACETNNRRNVETSRFEILTEWDDDDDDDGENPRRRGQIIRRRK